MPLGMVGGVSLGIRVLDFGGDRRTGRSRFGGKCGPVGHPIVTNWILCVRGGDAALPKLLWDFLLAPPPDNYGPANHKPTPCYDMIVYRPCMPHITLSTTIENKDRQ